MRAIILAAGTGSRMEELTHDKPKCMINLFGKPLIERQLQVLRTCGIENIAIVGGYLADKLKALKLPLVVNRRYAETNMVTTLFCAESFMQAGDDLIISYGDIVFEKRVLDTLLAVKAPIAVVVDKNWRDYWAERMEDPLSDAETLKLKGKDRIIELGKKTNSYNDIEGQYIGLFKVSGDYVESFAKEWHLMDRKVLYDGKDFENMYMTSYLQHLIEKDWVVRAAFIYSGWLEIDTVEDLKMYGNLLAEDKLKNYYLG